MGFQLTETATEDLAEIYSYIAEADGEDRAEAILEKFFIAFELLAVTPSMGWLREQLTGDDCRWWVVEKFLVLYRSNESDDVWIMRVIHGARDIEQILLS